MIPIVNCQAKPQPVCIIFHELWDGKLNGLLKVLSSPEQQLRGNRQLEENDQGTVLSPNDFAKRLCKLRNGNIWTIPPYNIGDLA